MWQLWGNSVEWREQSEESDLQAQLQRAMIGPHDSSIKLRGQKKEAASSFCPFAPVESFLVAKVGIGECSCCGDIDRVVT